MGAYLSSPIREKKSESGENSFLRFGATAMQGWRMQQEDAHNCIANFDENASFFAVYDGHGGFEVSRFTSSEFPTFVKSSDMWVKGRFGQALEDCFLKFDENLKNPEIAQKLLNIAGIMKDEDEDEPDENKKLLLEEAEMPIEDVLSKYGITFCIQRDNEKNGSDATAAKNRQRQKHARLLKPKRNFGEKRNKITTLKSQNEEKTNENESQNSGENAEDDPKENGMDKNLKRDYNGQAKNVSQGEIASHEDSDANSQKTNVDDDVLTTEMPEKKKICDGEGDVANDEQKSHRDDASQPLANGHSDDEATKNGEQVAVENAIKTLDNGEKVEEKNLEPENEDEKGDEEDDDDEYEGGGSDESSDEIDEESSDENEEDEGEPEAPDGFDDFPMPLDDTPGVSSGTTACVVVVKGDTLYVANAGDSRCVLCRDSRAVDLSIDHKPEDQKEMERIEKAGGTITIDGRVNGGLNLSRALGDHFYKSNVELPIQDQMISALPDIRVETLSPDDRFMVLACDGIWNSMSSQSVVDFVSTRLSKGMELSKICEEICDSCLADSTMGDGTGCDNMTIIIVDFKRNQQPRDGDEEKAPSIDAS